MIAVIPAFATFALPAAAATYVGRRAIRLGDTRARIPIGIGLAMTAGFVLLNGLSQADTVGPVGLTRARGRGSPAQSRPRPCAGRR